MPYVNANGVKIHVQELGDGPPLVMLHGLFVGSLASWYLTAAPSLAASHRVIAYDLRGHGLSEMPRDGYSIASHVSDLEAVLRRSGRSSLDGAWPSAGDNSIALAGHSFGALVALRYALARPGRVSRLALIEPPLPPSRFEQFDSFLNQPPEAMLEAAPESLRRVIEGGKRQSRNLVKHLLELVQETSLLADLRNECDESDESLATLRLPTLCVFGSGSSLRPVGDRLARAIPGARLAVLSGSHYLHLDAATELTQLLAEFFDG